MRILAALAFAVALAGCVAPAVLTQVSTSTRLDVSTGRTMVQASLPNGQQSAFILDTGAQSPVVTQSAVDAMGLEIIGEALLGSPMGGEPIPAHVVRLDGLTLGGVAPQMRDAVVVPEGTLPAGAGFGVLAPTQWSDQIVTIDLASNQLSIGSQPPLPIAAWYPLSERNLTVAEIEVAGERVMAHFDTGNSRGVVLPLRLAGPLGLEGRLVATEAIRTVDAATPAFTASGDVTLKIGTLVLQARDVTFVDRPMANIGTRALRGYALVLDNPNHRWGLVGPL
jgi:predicted aspartyl protease